MVEVRVSRQAQEILAAEGTVADVTRLDVQVLGDFTGTEEVRVSRQAVEVLAAEGAVAGVTRLDVQVLGDFTGTEEVRVSRQAVEVLGGELVEASVTRLDVQVLGDFTGTEEVRISRQSIECLARQGSAGPVLPLALADDAHIFLHNWATRARMRTSFRNSVTPSPDSGAESRRGLGVKPYRVLDLEWLLCDGTDLESLERLDVFFRRMGNARFQMPIYMDQVETSVAHVSADDTIAINTRQGRFFPGARVGIVQLDACNQSVSFSFHSIDDMTNSSLTFSTTLGVDVAVGSYVFPIMDCEIALEVESNFITARVPSVKITVSEAPGSSQLPPLKSDTPTGAELAHDGRPIWFEEPDWASGISKGRSRQGSRTSNGRADFVSTEGDRSRQTHKFIINGKRDEMWNALEFFETRRGRLRSFWHIDQDQYIEVVDIDASGTFIGVSENTLDLTDFQEEFDAVGLVMNDGQIFVRDVVSIADILTVFRITLGSAIATGLSPTNALRCARARLCRFTSDEFVETWTHTGYMTASIEIIEVLNEQDFTI